GGENKQGESGTTKMATECAYYQLTIDGKEVIEIDVINMVLKVGVMGLSIAHACASAIVSASTCAVRV
ncbi:phage major tail tube protein, partial [Escherichia coli]